MSFVFSARQDLRAKLPRHANEHAPAAAIAATAMRQVIQSFDLTPDPEAVPNESGYEEHPQRAADIEAARRMWQQSLPIAGTSAELYLIERCRIPAPPNGWPSTLRYSPATRSLVLAATDGDGVVRAVHLVHLNQHGEPSRTTRGALQGALVRLPGDQAAPLLMVADAEAGLAVWRSTGQETWISFGLPNMRSAVIPPRRRIVVCADDHPHRAAKGGVPMVHLLRGTVSKLRNHNPAVIVAYPWSPFRQNGTGFRELIRESGIEAVRHRIAGTLVPAAHTSKRVSVDEARKQLETVVASFFARTLLWGQQHGNTTDAPPVEALRIDVGVGKTGVAHDHILHFVQELRAGGGERTVAIAVPTRHLAAEQAERIVAAMSPGVNVTVRVWRGRDADDPDAAGEKMCRDRAAVELARSLGADPQETVCRRKLGDDTVNKCRHFDVCGYQRQRRGKADIWIVAHEMLFTKIPPALGTLAALVIDESFWKAGLRESEDFPLDRLDSQDTVPDGGIATQRLMFLRKRMLDLLRDQPDGALSRAALRAFDFDAKNTREACELEFRRKPDDLAAALVPNMDEPTRQKATDLAAIHQDVVRLARFWGTVNTFLSQNELAHSGWISLDRSKDGVRRVAIKGRNAIARGWHAPTLLLDAVLNPDLIRPYYRDIAVTAELAVEAPFQRVRQVIDRAYAKGMLDARSEKVAQDLKETKRRERHLGNIWTLVVTEALRVAPHKVLVVLQKSVETAFLAVGGLPENVATAHHNDIAGRDQWKDVASLIVVGRTLPNPNDVAEVAEALSGEALSRLEGWYERVDAVRETKMGVLAAQGDRYPDRMAEAVRRATCDAELIQILGRGRGVNRTAANPLDVILLCDTPLPVVVAETVTADNVKPSVAELMLAEGRVILKNPAHAFRVYPRLWNTNDEARKAFEREKTATFPYKGFVLGDCRTPLVPASYQLAGKGQKPAEAWFHPSALSDCRAWLTGRLGELAQYRRLPKELS